MSDNPKNDQGDESSAGSDAADDLFLSPDDSDAEEVAFRPAVPDDAPIPFEPPAEPAAEAAEPAAPQADAAGEISATALSELETERDDYRNRMMRVAADLENFRKRTAREKEDMRKYGIDRVVLELLPVLDNLERAMEHADKSDESTTTIVDGVRMVHRQFVTALEKHGVRPFESKGEHFDPQRHEAIQQIDTTEHVTGFVMDQYQKGYYLHERLIRPALVVVARNPTGEVSAAKAESDADDEFIIEIASEGELPPAATNGAEGGAADSEPDESSVN